MNYQDYMNQMQDLAAKYNLTIDELKELLDMGYTEEDLAKMSVEEGDSKQYEPGGYVLPKHQTKPNVSNPNVNYGLSPYGYKIINQFENSIGKWNDDQTSPDYGQPIGMGMGNNYAQTAKKTSIENFIAANFANTWSQMPDELKIQIYDMAFNYGVNTPAQQKNVLAGLAQAIEHNTEGSNVPATRDYRANLSLQDAQKIINSVQDWSDTGIYNSYVNVRTDQMNSIATGNKIPKAYQNTMTTRPLAIKNMYAGNTSGYGFPGSTFGPGAPTTIMTGWPASNTPSQQRTSPNTINLSKGTGTNVLGNQQPLQVTNPNQPQQYTMTPSGRPLVTQSSGALPPPIPSTTSGTAKSYSIQNPNDGKLSFSKIGTGQNMGIINDAISKAGTNFLKDHKGLATGLGVANRVLKGGINTLSNLSKYDAAAQTQRQNAQAQQQALFSIDNGVERRKFDFQGQNDPLFALSAELGAKAVKTEDNMVNKNYSNNGVPIEAEGGEFYLTPSDGATIPIKGPSHDEGGVKFVAEEGSYIISDHIKISGAILNSIIGKPVMKENQNITFAEAIRKFPKYFDTKNDVEQLNNKKLDPIAANTFRVNLKNKLENLSKLIAHQQEQNNNNGEGQEGQEGPVPQQEAPQAQSGMMVPGLGYTLKGVDITAPPMQMAPGPTAIPLTMRDYYSSMLNRGLDNYPSLERPSQSQAELAIYSRIERANRDEDLRRLGISANENSLKQYENLKNNGYSHPQALQMVMDAKNGYITAAPSEADEFAKMNTFDKGLFMLNSFGPAIAASASVIPVPKPIQRGSIFQGATKLNPIRTKGKIVGFNVINEGGTKTRYTPSEIEWHLGTSASPFVRAKAGERTDVKSYAKSVQNAFNDMIAQQSQPQPQGNFRGIVPNQMFPKEKATYGPMSSQAEEIYQEQLPTGDLPSSYNTPPRFEYLIKDSKTGQLRSLTPQEKIDMNKGIGTLRYINPARMNNPIGNTKRREIDPSWSTDLVPENYQFEPYPKPGKIASTVQRFKKGLDPRERETVGGLVRTLTNWILVGGLVGGVGNYYGEKDNARDSNIDPETKQILSSFTDRERMLMLELNDNLKRFNGDTTAFENYLSTRTDSTAAELRGLLDKVKNIKGDKTIIYEREEGGKNESDNTQDTEQPSSVINNLILHPEAYADQLAALMEAKEAAREQTRPRYSPQTYPEFIQNYILPIMSVGNIPSVDEVSAYSMYDPTQQQMLPSEYMGGGYVLPRHQTDATVGSNQQTTTPSPTQLVRSETGDKYKTSFKDIETFFNTTEQGKKMMEEATRRYKIKYPNSPATPEEIKSKFLQMQRYNINAREWANDPNVSQEERDRRAKEMSDWTWDSKYAKKDASGNRYDERGVNWQYKAHDFDNGNWLNDTDIIRAQTMYNNFRDMQKEGFPGMENFNLIAAGVQDNEYAGDRGISKADRKYGNTTNRELFEFKQDPNKKQPPCGCMGDEPVSREHTEEESKMPGFKLLPCGTPCKEQIAQKFSCECVNNKPVGKADPNGTYTSAEEAAKAPGCCKEEKPQDKCACEKDPATGDFLKNAVVTKYSLDDPKWKNGSLAIQDCALLGQECSRSSIYRESLPMAMNLLTLPEPRTLNYREQYNFPRYDPQLVSYRSAKNDAASLQAQARAAGMPGQFSKLVDAYGKITEQENNTNAQIINQARQINTDIGIREQLAQQPANTRFIDANNADLAAIYADQYAKQKDLVSSQMGVNAYNTGLDFYQNMVGGFRVGSDGKIYNANTGGTTFGLGFPTFGGMANSTQVSNTQTANTAASPPAPASGTQSKKLGGKNTKKKKQFTKRKYF
jgi:hypothetical protein